MSKSKSRKHTAKHDPIDEPSLTTTTNLTSVDLLFLQRVVRFLVNVLDPGYADKARREGYSSKEHALGWQIWRTAAGETRPFEHWLRAPDVSDGASTARSNAGGCRRSTTSRTGGFRERERSSAAWCPRIGPTCTDATDAKMHCPSCRTRKQGFMAA